jgi:hypothetical protein
VSNALIPALPPTLQVVPGYRVDPATGKEDTAWRTEHFAWHENARDWRLWAQEKFLTDSAFREHLLYLCSRDSAFFSLVFLEIEEPRSMAYFDQTGITLEQALADLHSETADIAVESLSYRTIHPFIPFAYQVQAHRLATKVILGPMRSFYHDILWDKARGIGMSYAFLAWAYWGWLFVPGLRGTILTEKWDKAERTKDVNSLFGKLDLFLASTPDVLIPKGFKWRGEKDADRMSGRLINPGNGAAIFTEPTTADSTRSGREAYVAVDELNFHEYLYETWATIGGTTKHRCGWSSASRRYGRQGEEIFKQGREHPTSATVITLDWFENPHQDQFWYEQERERYRAAGQLEQFEVEYLRNPTAGSGRMVYIDQLKLTTKVQGKEHGYDPSKPLKISVDPAVSDFTAFVFWQTHFMDEKKRIRWLDYVQLRNMPVQFWAYVLTGILPRGAHTDANGVDQPPDEMYRYLLEGFFELPGIERVMAFMRDIPPSSLMLYGDPAITSRSVTHESWEKVFAATTLWLRQRELGADHPNAIPIMCFLPWEPLVKRNNFEDRRVGMRTAMMNMEWYWDNEGVRELYDCVENTMFQKTTETSTRPPGHLHTDQYHGVSACEFGMTWETLSLTPQELDRVSKTPAIAKPKTTKRTRPVRSASQRQRRAAAFDLARAY